MENKLPQIFIKPCVGIKVLSPDHHNQDLPTEGALVEASIYWQRRLQDGDVFIAEPETKSKKAAE